jgi:hypothetical protein
MLSATLETTQLGAISNLFEGIGVHKCDSKQINTEGAAMKAQLSMGISHI